MRRMERLEETFGFRLFDRLPDGVGLTAEGRRVYASAQQMERASHSLRAHLDQDLTTRGMVRCSVTEGLGTMWILPQLAQFSRTHPTTIVDLRCAMEVADVLRMEADVAVQLEKPDRPESRPCGSGGCTSIRSHRSATSRHLWTAERASTNSGNIDSSIRRRRRLRRMRCAAHARTCRALKASSRCAPTRARRIACADRARNGHRSVCRPISLAIGTDLIPLDIDIRHQVDIWMTYHPDARSISARVAFHRLAADAVRSQALSMVRRRIHSSARISRRPTHRN